MTQGYDTFLAAAANDRRDAVAMRGMIFGDAPTFEAVIATFTELETRLNATP